MKKSIQLLIIAMTFIGTAYAQSADEKAVSVKVDALTAALLSGDKQQLEAITADGLSYGHSTGVIESKPVFVQALTSGATDYVTADIKDQTVNVYGETAIVRHKLYSQIKTNGGAPSNVSLGVILVFQKQKGEWKLLARQAFKLPV